MKNVDGKIIKILENFRFDCLGLEFFLFYKYKCSGYEVFLCYPQISSMVDMTEERALGYLKNCLEGVCLFFPFCFHSLFYQKPRVSNDRFVVSADPQLLVLEKQGYCHTDLKPSNILITADLAEAHLCDLVPSPIRKQICPPLSDTGTLARSRQPQS